MCGASLRSTARVAFWKGGRLVVEGRLSVGELISFILYTGIVAMALAVRSDLWADFNTLAIKSCVRWQRS